MIALALSPIARYVFLALAILASAGGIYGKGRLDGRRACEDRVRAAVAAEQTRQARVRAKALDAAVGRELAAREANNEMQDKVDDYERELAVQSVSGTAPTTCPPRFGLRAPDVDGLRKLQR